MHALDGRKCLNCEYFDVGNMGRDGHSDCLNRLGPKFQTYADDVCPHWVKASEPTED